MNNTDFSLSDLDDLYGDIILDHYRSPRNNNEISQTDLQAEGVNPFCGDEVTIQIRLIDDVVTDVAFRGTGCSISQASASILTDTIKGKSLANFQTIYTYFRDMMYGRPIPKDGIADLGEAEALSGVKKFPIRVKCALLSWAALEDAIKKHLGR